jgi:hypothetical protein
MVCIITDLCGKGIGSARDTSGAGNGPNCSTCSIGRSKISGQKRPSEIGSGARHPRRKIVRWENGAMLSRTWPGSP